MGHWRIHRFCIQTTFPHVNQWIRGGLQWWWDWVSVSRQCHVTSVTWQQCHLSGIAHPHIQASSVHTHHLPSGWPTLDPFEALSSCSDEDMVTVLFIGLAWGVIWSQWVEHRARYTNGTHSTFLVCQLAVLTISFLLLPICAVLQHAYTLQKPTSMAVQPGAH